MKHYRFVVIISLLLAVALMSCQSEDVVATSDVSPEQNMLSQQLGVSEVVVNLSNVLGENQELILADISAIIASDSSSDYFMTGNVQNVGSVVFQLPIMPQGAYVDFNPSGDNDLGVQVFAIKVQDELVQSAPLSGKFVMLDMPPLAGLSIDFDEGALSNIVSGWILVWAPDNQQLFPVGSGEDGILFTRDDIVQPLEPGYTAMHYENGSIKRFRDAQTETMFSIDHAPMVFDLSALDAASAYDEVIQILQIYYPSWNETELTGLDAIKSGSANDQVKFSSMVAELSDDLVRYYPQGGTLEWLNTLVPADYGIRVNINANDEVRPYIYRLDGSADDLRMDYGDEIVSVNGKPVLDAINEQEIPFIGTRSEALQQKLKAFYLFRAQAGDEMALEIRTIAGETKTLNLQAELNSGWFSYALDDLVGYQHLFTTPVDYSIKSNYGYIRVDDVDKDPQNTRDLFFDALVKIQDEEKEYLLLDLQQLNGSQFLELVGFFTDQEMTVGELDCLDKFSQPVIVHPAEEKFEFKEVIVLTGEACSGACEMEVMALQQLENVTTYGLNPTAGTMNIGPQAQIKLPGDSQISFPICRFSSDLLDENFGLEPDRALTNSYYAAFYGNSILEQEAFADFLLQTEFAQEPEEKLQPLSTSDFLSAYYRGSRPEYTIVGDLWSILKYHDIDHYDLYGIFTEEDRMGTLTFTLCALDKETMDANLDNSSVSLALDGKELTDDEMSSSDFEFDDLYGRYENQPCMGWSAGYEKLLPGHHELLITLDVMAPVVYEDSYYEPGTYEFALHFLVQEEQVEEVPNE